MIVTTMLPRKVPENGLDELADGLARVGGGGEKLRRPIADEAHRLPANLDTAAAPSLINN